MTAPMINEKLVSIDPKSLEKFVDQYKKLKKGLESFEMTLTVSKPNNSTTFQKNVLFDVKSDSSRKLDEDAYDNFLDYVRFSYEKYVSPFFVNVCKPGDIVKISAELDEEGYFIEDTVKVQIMITVPNEFKTEWASYIDNKYAELTKFHDYVEGLEFETRNHKIQKITFTYNFEMTPEHTFHKISEVNKVDQDVIGQWYTIAEEVELKNREEKIHTHKIPVMLVQTEFGSVFQIKGIEIAKCKID